MSIQIKCLCTLLGLLLVGCGATYRGPSRLPPAPEGDLPAGYSMVDGQPIPDPFSHLHLWPIRSESQVFPIAVYYQGSDDEAVASRVVRDLEASWRAHTQDLGLRPPMAYAPNGTERFSAFLWRGFEYCLALPAPGSAAVERARTFMILDPWGPCGRDYLSATVAHEFHHAVTLGYSTRADEAFRVASATFAQDVVFDQDDTYMGVLADFQSHPDWPIGASNDFESYYPYGAALYLFFLRDRYFGGSPHFLGDLWAQGDSAWGGGVEGVLPDGVAFNDSVAEFAVWRYFTAHRSDGAHFEEGGLLPSQAVVPLQDNEVGAGPMVQSFVSATGSRYLQLTRDGDDPQRPSFQFEGDPGVDWMVQTIPASDGGNIAAVDHLDFSGRRELVLVVTALPRGGASGAADVERTYSFTATIGR